MVTDQKHSSDSTYSKQEVIRYTKKLAQIFRLNEQNAEVYTALSGENRALKKQLEDYHFQHNTLERKVKRLEKDVKSLETELEDLNECIDRKAVVNSIHEIVPLLIGKKDKKFEDIADLFPNIVHLNLYNSAEFSDKTLNRIAESYPNLKYLNLEEYDDGLITDKGLYVVINSCHKLEYLSISSYKEFSEIAIWNVIHSCPRI
ncbi:hypothetical protein C1645_736328 [Glomus cerebriforme]|uniref:F-box domain-containing protein n=1 Tax=Glomus cerebriforme TaxID=658196 RepID=A0A397T5C2_9GLOM|nr:hypothetical protein C1645_736328 [Glomus cerebriforme]